MRKYFLIFTHIKEILNEKKDYEYQYRMFSYHETLDFHYDRTKRNHYYYNQCKNWCSDDTIFDDWITFDYKKYDFLFEYPTDELIEWIYSICNKIKILDTDYYVLEDKKKLLELIENLWNDKINLNMDDEKVYVMARDFYQFLMKGEKIYFRQEYTFND